MPDFQMGVELSRRHCTREFNVMMHSCKGVIIHPLRLQWLFCNRETTSSGWNIAAVAANKEETGSSWFRRMRPLLECDNCSLCYEALQTCSQQVSSRELRNEGQRPASSADKRITMPL